MNEQTIVEEKEDEKVIVTEKLYYNIPKRLIDILGGIVGCILLIPITIIVKIAYILSGDFNSIFFKQERIGRYGKPIKIYKFRSMVMNADEVLFKMLEENPEIAREYKRYKKLKNDPRITKVGNFIRKASIDEFPQFINVLIGNMSLVGPRPYLYREKEDMGEYFNIVTKCKPGITGYWQVNGRSQTDFGYRLVLDEYYYNHRNLIMDIKILLKTIKQVVFKKGL
jgi:undecaprenyl-phosphate galactose phosphotransferase